MIEGNGFVLLRVKEENYSGNLFEGFAKAIKNIISKDLNKTIIISFSDKGKEKNEMIIMGLKEFSDYTEEEIFDDLKKIIESQIIKLERN